MCQIDEHNNDDDSRQQQRLARRLAGFAANLRNTGLPWHRVVALVALNRWRKIRIGSDCCGNLGQPGC